MMSVLVVLSAATRPRAMQFGRAFACETLALDEICGQSFCSSCWIVGTSIEARA
jgi:hypothetical protein